jgi:hypothetical protein
MKFDLQFSVKIEPESILASFTHWSFDINKFELLSRTSQRQCYRTEAGIADKYTSIHNISPYHF